jgi:hypothetical protein
MKSFKIKHGRNNRFINPYDVTPSSGKTILFDIAAKISQKRMKYFGLMKINAAMAITKITPIDNS